VTTCATCKHWGKAPETSTGVCLDEDYEREAFTEMRKCAGVPFIHGAPFDSKAVVRDGSGYSGQLLTLASFGCVLHSSNLPRNHCNRCDRCGFELSASRSEGCVAGDCSMRPLPERRTECAGCGERLEEP